jgi:hypothetical protein
VISKKEYDSLLSSGRAKTTKIVRRKTVNTPDAVNVPAPVINVPAPIVNVTVPQQEAWNKCVVTVTRDSRGRMSGMEINRVG